MSRCIPYTRPDYKREDVFLIGSIKKLQNQRGNTKQRKPVLMKLNQKQNKRTSRKDHVNPDSLHPKNKKKKVGDNLKFNETRPYARKDDSGHLERSDLSEEHDPPASVLNKYNSSKITRNSSMAKPGMIIRIKLPSKTKHKDLEPESANLNPSCSQPLLTDSAPCFQEGFVEAIPIVSRHSRRIGESCTQRLERRMFRDLIINWKPPSIQSNEADEGELDWLFATNGSQDAKPCAQICKAGFSDHMSSESLLQPRARYIPELNMFQMPYTIPY